jgi:hypothetical protein
MKKTFHEIWAETPVHTRRAYAIAINTSYGYLQRMACGYRTPSFAMFSRLKAVWPMLTMESFILNKPGRLPKKPSKRLPAK